MEHIRIIITGLALVCAVGLLDACDQGKDQETTAETALATHPITESAELTESSTETPTEAPTAALTEEIESHRPTREDWDENDPENPYYNLIQIGTAFDGKTPVYDGRYEFDYVICHTSDGSEFYSMQDALDWLEGTYV